MVQYNFHILFFALKCLLTFRVMFFLLMQPIAMKIMLWINRHSYRYLTTCTQLFTPLHEYWRYSTIKKFNSSCCIIFRIIFTDDNGLVAITLFFFFGTRYMKFETLHDQCYYKKKRNKCWNNFNFIIRYPSEY